MADVCDRWIPVLNVLVKAPAAWQRPAEVASALCRDDDATQDLLCELDLDGWIEVWEDQDGPLVSLTPLAAQRLGVRLVESGPGGRARWTSAAEPDAPQPRCLQPGAADAPSMLGTIVDPFPTPDLAAARAERAEAEARALAADPATSRRLDAIPRPTVLLGVGMTPWPGPPTAPGDVCPVCGNQSLRSYMYCLYCDRWGFDALLEAQPVAARPKPVRRDRPQPDRRAFEQVHADRLKSGRKSKHAERQKARSEAERDKRMRQRAQAHAQGFAHPARHGATAPNRPGEIRVAVPTAPGGSAATRRA